MSICLAVHVSVVRANLASSEVSDSESLPVAAICPCLSRQLRVPRYSTVVPRHSLVHAFDYTAARLARRDKPTSSHKALRVSWCTSLQRAYRLSIWRESLDLLLSNFAPIDDDSQPPAPGQKRVKEDWESIWYFGMFGSIGLATVLLYYKPDTRCVPFSSLTHAKVTNCRGP